jgi:hypothetical protein
MDFAQHISDLLQNELKLRGQICRTDGVARYLPLLWAALAWGWALLAGGGGLLLLIARGPWPPTNGWFALFSGLALCPATDSLLRRYFRVELGWPVRIGTALAFFLLGRIALGVLGRG